MFDPPPSANPSPSLKPKILFLHGSGTSPAIFRIQSRKLAALLAPRFELVYLAAPHPCPPGPGVLPFFEGCGPYLRWLDDGEEDDGDGDGDGDGSGSGGVERERAYWTPATGHGRASSSSSLDEEVMGQVRARGPFVAVVGFSQGAKVGMEVARRLQDEAAMERPTRGSGTGAGSSGSGDGGLRAVVCVGGTVPFRVGNARVQGDSERERAYRDCLGRGLVRAESVHLIGEQDPWRAEGEKLVEYFDASRRRVIWFKGGHHMPTEDAVNEQVAKLVWAACQRM